MTSSSAKRVCSNCNQFKKCRSYGGFPICDNCHKRKIPAAIARHFRAVNLLEQAHRQDEAMLVEEYMKEEPN